MDLLKQQPFNLRYYLKTTTDNKIYILFFYDPNNIAADTQTELESTYIPSYGEIWDETQTVTDTVYDDEVQLNLINSKICEYLNSREANNISQIKLINTSFGYDKIILEPKVFESITKCCSNIYIDLRSCAIRTTDINYKTITNLEIETGTLLLDKSTTLNIENAFIPSLKIDVFNSSKDDYYLNLMISKSATIINLNVYSTIKSRITCSNTNGNNYNKTSLNVDYYNIYGQEVSDDNNEPRLLIQGFESCLLNNITVNSDVSYGKILKLHGLNSCIVSEFNRTINMIDKGSNILVGGVNSLSLSNLNITINKESSITNNNDIISLLPSDRETTRKINIFDSNVINNSDSNINIVALSSVNIDSIYFSECTFTDNVKPLIVDNDSSLSKLHYDECVFSFNTSDYTIEKSTKLTLTDNTVNMKNTNFKISCNRINISGGYINFKNMIISNDSVIGKLSFTKTELNGEELFIENTKSLGNPITMFDDGSKFIVKKLTINDFKATLSNSLFIFDDLEFNTKNNVIINNSIIKPNKNSNIIFNTSVSATLCPSIDEECELNIKVNDIDKYLSKETIKIINSRELCPLINLEFNSPISVECTGYKNEYLNIKMAEDYDSDVVSKVIFNTNNISENKIINNSEKKCIVSEPELGDLDLLTYTITRK